jgi:hypothetical protein
MRPLTASRNPLESLLSNQHRTIPRSSLLLSLSPKSDLLSLYPRVFNQLKQKTGGGCWPETPVIEQSAMGKPLLLRLSIQPPSSLHPPEYPNGAESMVQHACNLRWEKLIQFIRNSQLISFEAAAGHSASSSFTFAITLKASAT